MTANLDCKPILEFLRKDFDTLWKCNAKGNSIEIITPFSTVTQKFVTVMIARRDGSFVVSDGGSLTNDLDLYGMTDLKDDAQIQLDSLIEHFAQKFGVAFTKKGKERFFYKKCKTELLLSSAVYDVANFIASCVNALSFPSNVEREQRQRFSTQATGFIQTKFPKTKPRYFFEDFKTAVFGLGVIHDSKVSLVAYITGARQDYFINEFKETIVNFEASVQSRFAPMVKSRVALIDNEAEGYSPESTKELAPFLDRYGATQIAWTDKESALAIL